MSLSNSEIGDLAELKFKEWLDDNHIPYWYIHQAINTFSPALKNYFLGKRPDFMILLPHLGFILVDVKHKNVGSKINDFYIDYNESTQYSNLQRNFNLEVWYAISNEHSAYKTWYWIPIPKIFEKGKRFTSSKSKEDYFSVKLEEFTQIAYDDSLDRLFSKLLLGEFRRK